MTPVLRRLECTEHPRIVTTRTTQRDGTKQQTCLHYQISTRLSLSEEVSTAYTMAEAPRTLQGHCLCGAIKFTVPHPSVKPSKSNVICHCRDCQRNGGSAYQVSAMMALEDIQFDDPENCMGMKPPKSAPSIHAYLTIERNIYDPWSSSTVWDPETEDFLQEVWLYDLYCARPRQGKVSDDTDAADRWIHCCAPAG